MKCHTSFLYKNEEKRSHSGGWGRLKKWVTNIVQTDCMLDPCLKFPCFPNESPPKVLQREQHVVESSKRRRISLNFACYEKGYSVLNHLYLKKNENILLKETEKTHTGVLPNESGFLCSLQMERRKEAIAQGSNTSSVTCCWKSLDLKGNLSTFISRLGLYKQ